MTDEVVVDLTIGSDALVELEAMKKAARAKLAAEAPQMASRKGSLMVKGFEGESRLVCFKLADGEVECVALDAGLVAYGKTEDEATVLLAAGKGEKCVPTGWHVRAHDGNPAECGRPWKGRLIPKAE